MRRVRAADGVLALRDLSMVLCYGGLVGRKCHGDPLEVSGSFQEQTSFEAQMLVLTQVWTGGRTPRPTETRRSHAGGDIRQALPTSMLPSGQRAPAAPEPPELRRPRSS
jgi:hypothetical protein